MRIKVDDIVEVQVGDDRVTGRVLKVDRQAGKVVVEGVNRVYKHVRKSQKNPQGGRLSREMPINWSNVMVICSACSKPAKMGARFRDDGSKERYCHKCSAATGAISPAHAGHKKS